MLGLHLIGRKKETILSDWLEKPDSQFERSSGFFFLRGNPSGRCSLRIVQNACASGEPWTSLLVRLEHRQDTVFTIFVDPLTDRLCQSFKDVRAQKFPHTDFFKTLTACRK